MTIHFRPRPPRSSAPASFDALGLPRPRTFAELTARARAATHAELSSVLACAVQRFASHDVGATAAELAALVLRGGKRIRAALVVAGWWAARPRSGAGPAVYAAAAVELLHAYLLVQDDWMDGDDWRRGGPSVHSALAVRHGSAAKGAAAAIVASDLGLGLALQCLLGAPVAPARILRATQRLLAEHESVLIGQQIDVLGETRDVEVMHALKTASYTFRAPLLVGAALAGGDERLCKALARYAEPLGIAFQLRDDVLGTFASPAITGKPFAGDLRERKVTAVTEAARERLRGPAARRFERLWGRRGGTEAQLTAVVADLEAAGVQEAVELRIDELTRRAGAIAKRLPVDDRVRGWLAEVVALVAKPLGPLVAATEQPTAGNGPAGPARRAVGPKRRAHARRRGRS